jgi:surfactin synthase thioesterase subunit
MPPGSPIELICFSYAGGNAAVLAPLRAAAPSWLRVHAVDLPGHGRRFTEPLRTDRTQLVAELARELRPQLRAPYALFGHSLGGLLAFELCHAFGAAGLPPPLSLFVSATESPSTRKPERFAGCETDAGILATLKRLGGTPPEVLANPELMELAIPILRADFALCAAPLERGRLPLRCPIRVFVGARDPLPRESFAAWENETDASFELETFDGDHFFVRTHAAEVVTRIAHHLRELAAASVPSAADPPRSLAPT